MARVFDLAAVCVSFLASFAVSSWSSTWPDLASLLIIRIKVANVFLFAGYLALCYVVFAACGFYRSHRLSHWKQRLYEVLLAGTLIMAAFLMLHRLFLISFTIREFLPLFWLLTFGALLLSHELLRWLLHLFRLRGRNLRNVVIVGEGPDVAALADRIRQQASLGYRVLKTIDAREIREDGHGLGDL